MKCIRVLAFVGLASWVGWAHERESDYLYVWAAAADTTRGSFLAVVDISSGVSPEERVVSITPAGSPSRGAHHTEYELGPDSTLLANAFGSGRTFLFDLRDARAPRVLKSLGDVGPFSRPHSYVRLPNGHSIATFQGKRDGSLPGGLVELDAMGDPVRWSSASTGTADSSQIVPYSLAVLPALDRIVSTSTHMVEDIGVHIQIWRLSSLELLSTLAVPLAPAGHAHAGEGSEHHKLPGEPRVLSDGRTVMFGTFTCGLYYVTGLDGDDPMVTFSHAFEGSNCAVPVVIGPYWVQTVPAANALVALDVSDPERPVEVSRLVFDDEVHPHWLAADASGRRLVTSSADRNDPTVRLVGFDPGNGTLAAPVGALVISFRGIEWPDGYRGDAVPHGVVFSRR